MLTVTVAFTNKVLKGKIGLKQAQKHFKKCSELHKKFQLQLNKRRKQLKYSF